MNARTIMPALAALGLLAGCASATREGQIALTTGRYAEAAAHFEEALAQEPASVRDLVGLGIARYRLGALDEADRAFADALAQRSDLPVAHLYLGLSALRRGHDDMAADHLGRYAGLGVAPRLAAHVQRTLHALQSGPVSHELREYMAAGIEDQAAWASEVAAAWDAARYAELRRLGDDRAIYLLPRACRCR